MISSISTHVQSAASVSAIVDGGYFVSCGACARWNELLCEVSMNLGVYGRIVYQGIPSKNFHWRTRFAVQHCPLMLHLKGSLAALEIGGITFLWITVYQPISWKFRFRRKLPLSSLGHWPLFVPRLLFRELLFQIRWKLLFSMKLNSP